MSSNGGGSVSTEDVVSPFLKQLASQPSTDGLVNCLKSIYQISRLEHGRERDIHSLRISSVIIGHTIPETYKLLSEEAKRLVCDVLGDRVSLSQLVTKVNLESEESGDQIYAKVLTDVVELRTFGQIFDGLNLESEQYFRNVKVLVLNKVIEALTKTHMRSRTDWLENVLKKYYQIVFDELLHRQLKGNRTVKLLDGLFSQDEDLVRYYFVDDDIHLKLNQVYSTGTTDWYFVKLLVKYLVKTLGSEEDVSAYFSVLQDFKFDSGNRLVDVASQVNEYRVIKILLGLAASLDVFFYEHLKQGVTKFGSKSYIDSVSNTAQSAFTKYLITLVAYCTKEQMDDLSGNPFFLDAVTNRLDSTLPNLRTLGMIFADTVYEKTNGESLFKMEEYQNGRKEFIESMGEFPMSLKRESLKDAVKTIRRSHSKPVVADIIQVNDVPSSTVQASSEMADSDVEDSDGSNGAERVKKVSIPVYLKELLAYLSADKEKDDLAYEKRKIAFAIASQMIRAKKGSPELEYYANSLLEEVLSASNLYNFEDFNSWKLSTMIAITVCEFESCWKWLLRIFVQGDISISTRVMILTCLSISSREKSGGYEDDFVLGKVDVNQFKPKQLPESIHRQFMRFENDTSPFLDDQHSNLKALDSPMENLSLGGKVVRMSSTLAKQRSGNGKAIGAAVKDTSFINKQLPRLFYALIGVWETVNNVTGSGFKLGGFSTLLNSEYFKNLDMIYECAIPSSIELTGMTKDLFITVVNELRLLSSEPKLDSVVFEAVLRCLKAVVDIDSDTLPKRELFSTELLAAYNILEEIMESGMIVEERLTVNCGYVMNKLMDGQ
ncbi:hypothetical protein FOA43_002536 [Brettanomyces nanus]|uniref:Telomere length regulation protein conserved domain-containing protein n=1 Tax=Eeniella nana TaxID=13502 RepID=A0A875S1D3_EENNA|nr:uncharacterized protein FOA43_002536 [Brettanomyces nanus]QPG75186.1 hypothetical protein FOA43_002536 [Brettanomyces nanus]